MNQVKLLLIDDEEVALDNLHHILSKENYKIDTAKTGVEGLQLVQEFRPDLVVTDLRMPGVDGFEILKKTKEILPDSEVIMITGYATVDSAIETMKLGAYHYITKPYKIDEVRKVVKEAAEKTGLKKENQELKGRITTLNSSGIITCDPTMEELLQTARKIATSDCSVLITGESGTGKELLAHYIHKHSNRKEGTMLAVNCGVFSEELLTSELFGHEKGAFTGAERKKTGIVVSANGGTLLLDEITEMTPAMQVKLLRLLQEKEVMPIGATRPEKVDVRFIAATNRNVSDLVSRRLFRQDLYFRINVVNLHLPPLADRTGDVPLLVHHFIHKFNALYNKNIKEITPRALAFLESYDYPGNIRELEHIMERAIVLSHDNTIDMSHLPDLELTTFRDTVGKLMSLEKYEERYIRWVLMKCEGKKAKAAEILGIDRVSLWRKLKKFGEEVGEWEEE